MAELFIVGKDFLLDILPGFVAAVLFYVTMHIIRVIKIYLDKKNISSKLKITNIYDKLNVEAQNQICKDAYDSRIIYIFATIEPTIMNITHDFYKLLKTKNGNIKIIFINPNSSAAKKREEELKSPAAFNETLNAYVERIKILQRENKHVKIALHEESIRNKFYIFDNVMYLGFRYKDRTTEEAPLYRIEKDSCLYQSFLLQFNDYWEKYYTQADEPNSNVNG